MFVGIGQIHIHIDWAQSLKSKRQVVKSLIAKIQNKFNVSVAEVDAQDLWQYSVIGVAAVNSNEDIVRQTLETAVTFIETNSDVQVVKFNVEVV